jgi:gliding motility-associated-like protein
MFPIKKYWVQSFRMIGLPLFILLLFGGIDYTYAQTLVADYEFNDSFLDKKGGSQLGKFDVDVTATNHNNNTSGFGADTNGSYWFWTSTASRGGGLWIDLENDMSKNYTIGIKFSFNNSQSGYRKIIDFKNLTSDNGFYFFGGGFLNFYPQSFASKAKILNNEILELYITRNASNNEFKVYSMVDGKLELELTYTDSSGDAVPTLISGKPRLRFFHDDTRTGSEATNGGKIYSLKVWDGPLIPEDIEESRGLKNKTKVTITAENKTRVFGDENPEFTLSYLGLEDGDTAIEIVPTISTLAKNNSAVGEYEITLAGGSDSKYEVELVPGKLTITPALLTVTADDKIKNFGASDPELTFQVSGLKLADSATILEGSLIRDSGESPGIYPIKQGSLNVNSNYQIQFTSGNFEILNPIKTKVRVTADNKTRVFGDENPEFTLSYVGLKDGDTTIEVTPTISTLAKNNSAVGEYEITLTGGSDSKYEVELVPGKLTITPALLRVIADDKIKIFGTSDPELTFQVSGLKLADSATILEGALNRDSGESPGIYPIKQGSLKVNSNYQIQFTSGNFEILASRLLSILEISDIESNWGAVPALLSKVGVITTDGQKLEISTQWNLSTLNVFSRGNYILSGDLQLPQGVENPDALFPQVTVKVLPKVAPQDITLSNASFEASANNQQVEIGLLKVIDAFDDIHQVTLPIEQADNKYFRLINNVIYWNSNDPAAGRKEFTVAVKIVDRDGNILNKSFLIKRSRKSFDDIIVYNTFTPQGDGVNDTWGVADLRFYEGVRIQIFDRGGVRVFYTENPDFKWDGTNKGKSMSNGSYFWTIEVKETSEMRKGILNLLKK